MTHEQLDNLVKVGRLKKEAAAKRGIVTLISSGRNKLKDAKNEELNEESQFDLAYNATHALSLAALQKMGYRPNIDRYIVFECLKHTLDISNEEVRILSDAHRARNLAEYEGGAEFNKNMIEAIIRIAEKISARLA